MKTLLRIKEQERLSSLLLLTLPLMGREIINKDKDCERELLPNKRSESRRLL